MKPISEEELMAYQMGECSWWRAWQIRRALESDPALAEEAASIAETLRAFNADAAPMVDAAMLERSWQRVRPSLAVLQPKHGVSARRVGAIAAGSALAGALAVLLLVKAEHRAPEDPVVRTVAPAPGVASAATQVTSAQSEMEGLRNARSPVFRADRVRTGPITAEPVNVSAEDAGLASYLDAAERVLTEVNHEDGPLPAETHSEVHRLLLENAIYERRARMQGDSGAASVMDDLGRALTSLDADPPKTASGADAFRLEFNVGGVLFDLRVLGDDDRKSHKQ